MSRARHSPLRRRRDRGALMGLVLVLMVVVIMASGMAMWSVRSDTASAGADRVERQLFDCAEQGLEWGKQYFSTTATSWTPYLSSNNVCSTILPCAPSGPFHNGTGTPPTNYPTKPPYTNTVTIGGQAASIGSTNFTSPSTTYTYTVAIYDNNDDDPNTNTNAYYNDTDGNIVVYSVCVESTTHRSKAVQAMIRLQVPSNVDYTGQAGFGFRNQGNQN